MKDEILKSFVHSFAERHDITDMDVASIFERFSNYCIISKQYPRDFDYENISIGSGSDTAIDGAAIIINGNIINSTEEIDFLLKNNGSLSVSFSFIQSKTSPKFEGSQILNFLAGIKNFFSEKTAIPENGDIANLRLIKNTIYKNSINLETPPKLDLFFVSTGKWENPEHINGLIKNELVTLEDRGLFSEIKFHCIDAEKLKEIYRETQNKTVKEIESPSLVSLPDIIGVVQSLVGSISIKEYLKLITDSDGNLQKNLFYDNIRDFQGINSVNQEIEKTLKSGDHQAAIAIYNNGITVIAKKIERISGKVKLTDYQIVNGCQTSHILYQNRELIKNESHIVLKIIETTDPEIAVSVIKATNRQTEVKIEAFESLSPFHKDLEEYYKAQAPQRKHPIYYERRSKQYSNSPTVKPNQVITLSAQIRSYVSTHLSQPQSTHRYFGELLESNRLKMFLKTDSHEKYYLSAYLLNRVESASKKPSFDRRLKPFKHHIVYVLYTYLTMTHPKKTPFNNIYQKIDDEKELQFLINLACNSIIKATRGLQNIPDAARSKALTDTLRQEILTALQSPIKTNR